MRALTMNQRWSLQLGVLVILAGLGCSSSGESASGSSVSSSGSSAAGTTSGTAAGNATSASATGGATIGGGTTGASTTGGSTTGGSSTGASCLDPSPFASTFTITDTAFCAVAIYTADEAASSTPSWGTHHGPLTFTKNLSDGSVTLERWSVQPGTDVLTKQSTPVAVGFGFGTVLGAQANDLPFFGWTTISWTSIPSLNGSIAAIANGAVAQSYTVNGPYWLAGISDGQGQGRLLYTGLSPLGMESTTTSGLYAADACSLPMQELGAGTGCDASALIAAWDEGTGPLAVDKSGNAFAVLSAFSTGNQHARGFLAANVARGQGATPGVPLFTLPGFAGSLAAITPTSTTPGLLVFQPFDSTSFDALDVVEQAYTVDTDVAPMGTPATLLRVTAATTTGLSLMTDDTDRLWVSFTGASSTTYVVLARVP